MAKSTPTTFDPAEEPKAPKAAKTATAQAAAPKTVPAPAVEHATYPGQTLGIVALVLAFFLPLPALALGIIAWVWSHKAGKNNVLAKISVGVSGAFTVIGIFFFGIWLALAGAVFGGLDRGYGELHVGPGAVQIMPGEMGGMQMPGDMDDMMHEFDEEMGGGHMKPVPATPSTTAPTDEAVTN